ncbi:isoaspartyl peptidase/L-asparaginase [bacterium]|nr:isoaspartyl peptidase/L-asparaginase [bacterium]
MKLKIFSIILSLLAFISMNGFAQKETSPIKYAFVIHGGTLGAQLPAEDEKEVRAAMKEALLAGKRILESGGKSMDAVEAAIKILEDSPWFNAGRGAVFTSDGTNELDASIMDGSTLKAGSVAGLTHIKNPISLARMVMERTKHVMLAREGAEAFAKEQHVEMVDPKYFFTQKRWDDLEKEKKKSQESKPHGTVGAVALDLSGNLAAGTSTGGTTNKKFGRIGDSPIIGAGTYANNHTCAVSATGTGEYFIRLVAAHEVSSLIEKSGKSIEEAANEVILQKLKDLGGDGGLIAIDTKGSRAMPFVNEAGMKRGYINDAGEPVVLLYKDR